MTATPAMYFGCLFGTVVLVLALAIASGRARRSERGKRAAAAIRRHFFGDGEVHLGCLLGLLVPALLLPIALGRVLRSLRGGKDTATVPRPFVTCEQDRHRVAATGVKPSLALKVNTIVVIGLPLTWLALTAIANVVSPVEPTVGGILGAILFLPLFGVFCVCCYRSVFRCNQAATRTVTTLYFVGAGLNVLALIVNIGEAVVEGDRLAPDLLRFLVIVAAICVLIAIYLSYCGVLSLRWQRRLREHATNQSPRTDG